MSGESDRHQRLGLAFSELGQHAEAAREFREAVRLDPAFAEGHYMLGDTLIRLGDLAGAERAFRETLRVKRNAPEARLALGVVLSGLGRHLDGFEEICEAIRLQPDYSMAIKNLAGILDEQGKWQEARGYWVQASQAEKDPEWVKKIRKRLAEPD